MENFLYRIGLEIEILLSFQAFGRSFIIKSQAGLNSYKISVKQWISKTNAIGIISKAGRYGGTYAHKDIAFEF